MNLNIQHACSSRLPAAVTGDADKEMPLCTEPLLQRRQVDFAGVLWRRAQNLVERMAFEIESEEAKSSLGRLMADAIDAQLGAEAEAIHTAMHWAPAVVAGNITEAELVRRLDGIASPELICAAVRNYREILCNVARKWAGAIANGFATEVTVVQDLGMPADVVNAAVAEHKRAYGSMALANATEQAEKAARAFRSVVTRK